MSRHLSVQRLQSPLSTAALQAILARSKSAFSVMMALAGRIHRLSVNNRYIEYRGLAEGMRTLYFWRAAGVNRWAWVSCLPRQTGAVHWIAQAVRSIEFC